MDPKSPKSNMRNSVAPKSEKHVTFNIRSRSQSRESTPARQTCQQKQQDYARKKCSGSPRGAPLKISSQDLNIARSPARSSVVIDGSSLSTLKMKDPSELLYKTRLLWQESKLHLGEAQRHPSDIFARVKDAIIGQKMFEDELYEYKAELDESLQRARTILSERVKAREQREADVHFAEREVQKCIKAARCVVSENVDFMAGQDVIVLD